MNCYDDLVYRGLIKDMTNNEDFKCIEQKTIFPFNDSGDGFYMAKVIKIK